MNEAEAKFIWIMLNGAGGGRSQPCFYYAEREDFGDNEVGSTILVRAKTIHNDSLNNQNREIYSFVFQLITIALRIFLKK